MLAAMLCGADVDHYVAKLAFMGREEQTESFSGRTTIWPAVSVFIQQRYWFGHGYDSFWTPYAIEEITRECQWPIREAHSAYYETMLHLGAIGLGLLLTTVGVAIVLSFTAFIGQRDPSLLFWTAMLLNGLFNGIFESGIVMITLPTFMISLGLMRLALVREIEPIVNKRKTLTNALRVPAWGVST
jgi:O-antigen ligase